MVTPTRFGFERASQYRISSQWEGVPDEAIMIVVFVREAMPEVGGIAGTGVSLTRLCNRLIRCSKN